MALSTNDTVRFMKAVRDRSEIKPVQLRNWLRELVRTSETITAQGKSAGVDTMTAFWIKLHGVLVDGGKYFDVSCTLHPNPKPATFGAATHRIRDAIYAMRDKFDEDELIYLHYRRDVECHIWQESYDLRVKNGKLEDTRKFALLGGRTLTTDEFDKRARAFLRRHNIDEQAIAVEFAKRVTVPSAGILAEYERFCES